MTRLMVLGLLKTGPMSGYEIHQVLGKSQTDTWAGVLPGSVYHALKKMEKEGLVEIDSIEQTGNRSKAIYKITEAGEREFDKLLLESLQMSSVLLPSSLYTGLSFVQYAKNSDIVASLKKQQMQLMEELEKQQEGIAEKRKHIQVDAVTEMVLQNVVHQYELQLNLINKLLDHYAREGKTE
ncbi:MAG: PadR family transcriptional regulator [Lysinibacillus sp.]